LSAKDSSFHSLRNPEWKSIRSKLGKAYPDMPDISREAKYESFQKSAAASLTELKAAYELLVNLAEHALAHLSTIKTMLAQLECLDLSVARSSTRDLVSLFNGYVRLVFYVNKTLEDRKMVAAVYNSASFCAVPKSNLFLNKPAILTL